MKEKRNQNHELKAKTEEIGQGPYFLYPDGRRRGSIIVDFLLRRRYNYELRSLVY